MFMFILLVLLLKDFCDCRICTINDNTIIKCDDELKKFNILSIFHDSSVIAFANYQNNINRTGWANLEIHTNPNVPDLVQSYYAGFLEGFLTSDLITIHWHNKLEGYCESNINYCERLRSFIEENDKFVSEKIQQSNCSFWHHVNLIYQQIKGMENAYYKHMNTKNGPILLWMNLRTELDNIASAINYTNYNPIKGQESCSAIVKPLVNGNDLFVSHNTWAGYSSMLRIVKKYNFSYHLSADKESPFVPGQSIAFSSSPGAVFSIDDYYITSAQLVIQETTISNWNKSLYSKYVKPNVIVFEFIRNMVANRIANSGKEWAKIYETHNSGTYNNQFMIVDYKQFKTGTAVKDLSNDLLWVIEQLPGMVHSEDVTEVIRQRGYWSSYNIPYYKDVYQISGYPKMVKKYGDYYSYDKTSRAQIFKRDEQNVTDMKSLYKLMRFNDFKNDPLSRCNCSPPYSAYLTIAARSDLNDPNGHYPIDDLSYDIEGAIDVKMTNHEMVKNLEMFAENGPSHVQQPVFQWSKLKDGHNMRHLGLPDKWDFPLMKIKWYPETPQIAIL